MILKSYLRFFFYLGKEKASKIPLIRQESENEAKEPKNSSPGNSNLNLNQSIRERLRNRVRSSGSDVSEISFVTIVL